MARHGYQHEINEDTPREILEQCIVEASHSSDTNVQRAAAQAQAQIVLREHDEWRHRFEMESRERVDAQRFQEAQVTRQLEVADRHVQASDRQLEVAETQLKVSKWTAAAAIASAVLVAILAVVGIVSLVHNWEQKPITIGPAATGPATAGAARGWVG